MQTREEYSNVGIERISRLVEVVGGCLCPPTPIASVVWNRWWVRKNLEISIYSTRTILQQSAFEVRKVSSKVHDEDLVESIGTQLRNPDCHVVHIHVLVVHIEVNRIIGVQGVESQGDFGADVKSLRENEGVRLSERWKVGLVGVASVKPNEQGDFRWISGGLPADMISS